MREPGPFFLTGAVLVDLERVDAYLGFEEGCGGFAVGEREGVAAGAVVGRGGDGRWRGGKGWERWEEALFVVCRERHRGGS